MTGNNRRDRTQIITRVGSSICGGINVGRYPLHEFHHFFGADPLRDWPLRLRFAGYDNWVKGCYRYRENSDTFALELVTDGVFDFTQNGVSFQARPGELFLVHLGADTEMSCDSVEFARKATASFAGPLLPSILNAAGLAGVSLIPLRNPEKFIGYFEYAERLLKERQPGFSRLGSILAYEILLELSSEQKNQNFPERLERIVDYLNRNLSEPITIGDLCRRFNLSPTGIFRLFQKHLDSSVIDFLIRRRMEVAAELLEITELPIKEIADRTGYRNALYFSGEFRRFHGCAPRDFRRARRISTDVSEEGRT